MMMMAMAKAVMAKAMAAMAKTMMKVESKVRLTLLSHDDGEFEYSQRR